MAPVMAGRKTSYARSSCPALSPVIQPRDILFIRNWINDAAKNRRSAVDRVAGTEGESAESRFSQWVNFVIKKYARRRMRHVDDCSMFLPFSASENVANGNITRTSCETRAVLCPLHSRVARLVIEQRHRHWEIYQYIRICAVTRYYSNYNYFACDISIIEGN